MNRRLRIAPGANAQIEAASDWWFEHRPMAPTALDEDLERSFELIRSAPGVGRPVKHPHYPGLRRIFLGRVRYHLYYRELSDVVEVVALWHASRGTGPDL